MSNQSAYQMIRKLMLKSRGFGKPDGADAELVAVLVALNPDTLVHALHKGEPICGHSREVSWDKATHWPETEVWVGIRNGEVVNCPGCQARLSEVLAYEDIRIGFNRICKTLNKIR